MLSQPNEFQMPQTLLDFQFHPHLFQHNAANNNANHHHLINNHHSNTSNSNNNNANAHISGNTNTSCNSNSNSNTSCNGNKRLGKSKTKRVRTIFTPEQLKRLEQEFSRQMYLVGDDRVYLADSLCLTEAQVKVWFQNRRIKARKLNPGTMAGIVVNNNHNTTNNSSSLDNNPHRQAISSLSSIESIHSKQTHTTSP